MTTTTATTTLPEPLPPPLPPPPENKAIMRSSSALEEEENYPKTLEEELDEIREAFYEVVDEDTMRELQGYAERLRDDLRVADGAVQPPAKAPDFELIDQDGETVKLSEMLKAGPVVILFYRGKWCPHCNASVMAMQKRLHEIKQKGAQLVAISPMNPDGTQAMASKRCLEFPVLSDVGNAVARKFKITFRVPPEQRASLLKLGSDIPGHNGDDLWEIPIPATYIVNTDGEIHWAFLDNDTRVFAEPSEIIDALPTPSSCDNNEEEPSGGVSGRKRAGSSSLSHRLWNSLKRKRKQAASKESSGGDGGEEDNGGGAIKRVRNSRGKRRLFGAKQQEPGRYIMSYCGY